MLWMEKQEEVEEWVEALTPDGSGGQTSAWAKANTFSAAITQDSATKQIIGQKEVPVTTYSITSETELYFHEVIKSADSCYRIINKPDHTPPYCSFQFWQAQAEEWSMP